MTAEQGIRPVRSGVEDIPPGSPATLRGVRWPGVRVRRLRCPGPPVRGEGSRHWAYPKAFARSERA